jgi:hypothetical protein
MYLLSKFFISLYMSWDETEPELVQIVQGFNSCLPYVIEEVVVFFTL